MRYNFETAQDEVLHFLHLRIEKLLEENKNLKNGNKKLNNGRRPRTQ